MDNSCVCVICGKGFAARKGAKYCGTACRAVADRKRYEAKKAAARPPDKPCAVCGRLFAPRAKDSRYCSADCRREGVRQYEKQWQEREKERKKERAREQERRKPYAKKKSVKSKLRTPPEVTIEDVCRWQAEYKARTGVWLGYHQALEQMRKEGYAV